jgi:hypothetical protein
VSSHRDKRKEKLVRDAQPVLSPDEQVLDATTGMVSVKRGGQETSRNGVVVVTNRRVVLFTKKLGGYDVQDFAFGLLSSVNHKRGMTYGNLDLASAGGRAHVKQIPKDEVEGISQLIRQRMALAHESPSAPPLAPTAAPHAEEDVATTIRNLAALRDEGLLAPDEFEAKKRQLLGL